MILIFKCLLIDHQQKQCETESIPIQKAPMEPNIILFFYKIHTAELYLLNTIPVWHLSEYAHPIPTISFQAAVLYDDH